MTRKFVLNAKGEPLYYSYPATRHFYGTDAPETLTGTDGHDSLWGKGGDTLIGGKGDDWYYSDRFRSDRIVELPGEGIDTVVTYGDFVLPPNVENLSSKGNNKYAVGNDLDNIIYGGAGSQTIVGGGGNNVLAGGAGADTFVITAGRGGSDVILDFETGPTDHDVVRLKGSTFYTFESVLTAMTQQGADVVLRLNADEILIFRDQKIENFAPRHFQLPIDMSALTLTFAEEFDGPLRLLGQPGGIWRPEYGYGGNGSLDSRTLRGNGEKQIYVDPAFRGTAAAPLGLNPFRVEDGVLTITAERADPAIRPHIWGYEYTSGLINTSRSFNQLYGYFEMKAILPEGKGFWPAFWLLPQDGTWPPELDVMEMLGHDPNVIHTSAHSRASGSHTNRTAAHYVGDTSKDWHTYGVLWGPQETIWYVDGVEVFRIATPADMHKPMYMLINLAVGGGWPGDPNASTPFPGEMKIDWVRAYAHPSQAPAPPPPPPPPPPPEPTLGHHQWGSTETTPVGGVGGQSALAPIAAPLIDLPSTGVERWLAWTQFAEPEPYAWVL